MAALELSADLVQWLQTTLNVPLDYWLSRYAVEHGDVKLLSWLYDHISYRPQEAEFYQIAAERGDLEILQWLKAHGCPWDSGLWDMVTYKGNLEVLSWLHQNGFLWDADACDDAAYGGRLDLVQWFRQHGYEWGEETCRAAAANGHLDVLQWLRAQGCPWDVRDVFRDALRNGGHWSTAHWVASQTTEPFEVPSDVREHISRGRGSGSAPCSYQARYWLSQRYGVQWEDSIRAWLNAITKACATLQHVLCADVVTLIERYV